MYLLTTVQGTGSSSQNKENLSVDIPCSSDVNIFCSHYCFYIKNKDNQMKPFINIKLCFVIEASFTISCNIETEEKPRSLYVICRS